MKLIQKHFIKGGCEFELSENSISVKCGPFFNKKQTTHALTQLDPYPEVNAAIQRLTFHRADKSGPAFTLQLNNPAAKPFESFVNMISEYILRHQNAQRGNGEIRAYSQRLTSPFSGLVQIAESDRARALTMDGNTWELQYKHIMLDSEGTSEKKFRHRYSHVLTVNQDGLQDIVSRADSAELHLDSSLIELAQFLSEAAFPFPATDVYEYWLLDQKDESPLAMIFSCSDEDQMATFPNKTEWNSLPAAAMPVELTEAEKQHNERPVNIRVEQMVAERAGSYKAKARWFKRSTDEAEFFPPFMLREDWDDDAQAALCQRYLHRQSSRLLMLHNLSEADRGRLEVAARPHVFEVQRFKAFYPEVVDEKLMKTILVEARLRNNTEANDPRAVQNRRDGVLYQ